MNRIDRLTALIIFLQGRQRVSIDDIAGRYNISPRTAYRDLAALQEAGVPIGSEPGEGYFIVKGYHLPPVMFNRGEATSLLAAERLVQRWSETSLGKSYLSALDKIRAVLPPDEKEYFDILDHHTKAFYRHNDKAPMPDDKVFSFLYNAIFKKEVIKLDYYSPYKEDKTTRRVEPLGLLLMGNHWYLAGWCRLREDYRMFRLDRFERFQPTGIKLPDSPEHTLKDFYDNNLRHEKELTEVVVLFDKEMLRYIGDQKYYHGWAWEKKTQDGTEMTFLVSHIEYFSRWLLTWGNAIRIIRPAGVNERVKSLAKELYYHYAGDSQPANINKH